MYPTSLCHDESANYLCDTFSFVETFNSQKKPPQTPSAISFMCHPGWEIVNHACLSFVFAYAFLSFVLHAPVYITEASLLHHHSIKSNLQLQSHDGVPQFEQTCTETRLTIYFQLQRYFATTSRTIRQLNKNTTNTQAGKYGNQLYRGTHRQQRTLCDTQTYLTENSQQLLA